MITRERVKEITLEDIFLIAEILSAIDISGVKFSGKSETEIGTSIMLKVMKSSKKIKKDFYQLIANVTEQPTETVKKTTFKELMLIWETTKEINDLNSVFQQAKEMI